MVVLITDRGWLRLWIRFGCRAVHVWVMVTAVAMVVSPPSISGNIVGIMQSWTCGGADDTKRGHMSLPKLTLNFDWCRCCNEQTTNQQGTLSLLQANRPQWLSKASVVVVKTTYVPVQRTAGIRCPDGPKQAMSRNRMRC